MLGEEDYKVELGMGLFERKCCVCKAYISYFDSYEEGKKSYCPKCYGYLKTGVKPKRIIEKSQESQESQGHIIMRMLPRTGNPALSYGNFSAADSSVIEKMTLEGTTSKTLLLLFILIFSATLTWYLSLINFKYIYACICFGVFFAAICGLIIVAYPSNAWRNAPFFALFEGFAIGGISSYFEVDYNGLIIQSVGLTIIALLILLLVYKLNIINITDNNRLVIASATGTILIYYIINLITYIDGYEIPFLFAYEFDPVRILFSIIVVPVAALNLVLDFDFIEKGANNGVPKYMEWYGAFGLLTTLLWLYLAIIKLAFNYRRRNGSDK